jgi:hypothetical protein
MEARALLDTWRWSSEPASAGVNAGNARSRTRSGGLKTAATFRHASLHGAEGGCG